MTVMRGFDLTKLQEVKEKCVKNQLQKFNENPNVRTLQRQTGCTDDELITQTTEERSPQNWVCIILLGL